MRRMTSRLLTALGAAAITFGALGSAIGQEWPSKPIRIVVPFVPGGPVDIQARLIGDKLSEALNTTVVVENRPGAGGNIGAASVARAEPDGYTFLLASGSILTINEFLYPSLSFNPEKELAPITTTGDMPLIVVVNADNKSETLEEFIEYAKANKGNIFFSSPGNGTTPHLGSQLLQREADVSITHVPYKGGAQSITAVVSGEVTGAMETPPSALPHIQAGKIKPLAVAGPERLAHLPDVPTTAEAGYPNIQVLAWFALVAPEGTPEEILDRMNTEVRKALEDESVRERFAALGIRPAGMSRDEFAAYAAAERERWGKIVKEAGIRLE